MKKILIFILLLSVQTLKAQNTVDYKHGDQELKGIAYTTENAESKKGILILPAWMGIDQHSKDVAEKLKNEGYSVFIADIYGKGNYPQNSEEAGKQAGIFKGDRKLYRKRIELALEQLIKLGVDKNKIAVIGYCFGGTGALEVARDNDIKVKAVVSFHGGLKAGENMTAKKVQEKVLICHGADDPFETKENEDAIKNELRSAEADWQMIYYSNAVHAFTDPSAGADNSKGAAYNTLADQRSWEDMMQLFSEIFK